MKDLITKIQIFQETKLQRWNNQKQTPCFWSLFGHKTWQISKSCLFLQTAQCELVFLTVRCVWLRSGDSLMLQKNSSDRTAPRLWNQATSSWQPPAPDSCSPAHVHIYRCRLPGVTCVEGDRKHELRGEEGGRSAKNYWETEPTTHHLMENRFFIYIKNQENVELLACNLQNKPFWWVWFYCPSFKLSVPFLMFYNFYFHLFIFLCVFSAPFKNGGCSKIFDDNVETSTTRLFRSVPVFLQFSPVPGFISWER